jgi:hypothetical protein
MHTGANIGMTTLESPAARELARQLLERETGGVTEGAGLGAAMQRACVRVSDNLRRSIGEDGYRALLARALVRTESAQPVLKHIRRTDAAGIHLDVTPAIEGHGPVAVSMALEALLAALVDILGDLIGADMVRNLLIYDDSARTLDGRRIQ